MEKLSKSEWKKMKDLDIMREEKKEESFAEKAVMHEQKLIYKQRKHDLKANEEAANYMASLERENPIVFCKLNAGDELQDFTNENEVAALVSRLKESNILLFRGIVSMKNETMDELDLKSLDDWKIFIEKSASIIRDGNNIKVENFEYVCSVHIERGCPHFHISFWDKSNHNINHFVHPSKLYEIREALNLLLPGYKVEDKNAEITQNLEQINEELKELDGYLSIEPSDTVLENIEIEDDDLDLEM